MGTCRLSSILSFPMLTRTSMSRASSARNVSLEKNKPPARTCKIATLPFFRCSHRTEAATLYSFQRTFCISDESVKRILSAIGNKLISAWLRSMPIHLTAPPLDQGINRFSCRPHLRNSRQYRDEERVSAAAWRVNDARQLSVSLHLSLSPSLARPLALVGHT